MSGETHILRREVMEERPDLPLTPMIDIIFQLLIFFMFALKFSGGEGWLYARFPTNMGPNYEHTPPLSIHRVRVKLLWVRKGVAQPTWSDLIRQPYQDPSGDRGCIYLKVDRTPCGVPGKPDWRKLLQRIGVAKSRFRPTRHFRSLPVIIEAYKMVPFKYVIYALNTVLKAGITHITLAAPEIPIR
ncbi:MAG: hypothetical protein DRP63_01315 [Planctomycetota bacterium]|nr:MAG: hypothetical protein DRP63_01315 [Planctomycetota bacterium]